MNVLVHSQICINVFNKMDYILQELSSQVFKMNNVLQTNFHVIFLSNMIFYGYKTIP